MKLKIEHISKSFGDNQVLKDVSFELEEGKIYVLMGANGSGKTTLYNIICGLLEADSGNIILDSNQLKNLSLHEINKLGIVRSFQDLRLIEELTVFENVLLAFDEQEGEKWWKILFPNKTVLNEQASNKSKAYRILEECFIFDVAKSKAGEISYGQQKLLTLACSIANSGDLLLLDEPVAGVNPAFQLKISDLIKKIQKSNKTILIIEHNIEFVASISDEIFFLNKGKISRYKDYKDLQKDDNVREAYV